MGIRLLFLPPTASELNPIEVMWAYFKSKWKRKLYDEQLTITPENSKRYIEATLEEVAHLSQQLT